MTGHWSLMMEDAVLEVAGDEEERYLKVDDVSETYLEEAEV